MVVLTGAGRAFCAGYDLADADELAGLGALGMLDKQERAARALLAIRTMRLPVIAAVNGPAAGGGLALAVAADIRRPARPPSQRGVRANRAVRGRSGYLVAADPARRPRPRQRDLLHRASRPGEEAARIGLVNAVSDPDALLDDALALAAAIVANSPGGVQLSKRALQANQEISSYAAALELENRGQALLTRSEDMPEALAAFKDKRPPAFTGR